MRCKNCPYEDYDYQEGYPTCKLFGDNEDYIYENAKGELGCRFNQRGLQKYIRQHEEDEKGYSATDGRFRRVVQRNLRKKQNKRVKETSRMNTTQHVWHIHFISEQRPDGSHTEGHLTLPTFNTGSKLFNEAMDAVKKYNPDIENLVIKSMCDLGENDAPMTTAQFMGRAYNCIDKAGQNLIEALNALDNVYFKSNSPKIVYAASGIDISMDVSRNDKDITAAITYESVPEFQADCFRTAVSYEVADDTWDTEYADDLEGLKELVRKHTEK